MNYLRGTGSDKQKQNLGRKQKLMNFVNRLVLRVLYSALWEEIPIKNKTRAKISDHVFSTQTLTAMNRTTLSFANSCDVSGRWDLEIYSCLRDLFWKGLKCACHPR